MRTSTDSRQRSGLRALCGAVVALSLTVQLSGCTFFGLVGGAMYDSVAPEVSSIPADQLAPRRQQVGTGASIYLVIRDGERLSGRHDGFVEIEQAVYAERYAQAARQGDITLPLLGEQLTVLERAGQREGRLAGFDYRFVWLQGPDGNRVRVGLENVIELRTHDGGIVSGATLRGPVSRGAVPFQSAIALHTARQTVEVPLDRISAVEIHRSRGYWWKWGLTGLAIDVGLIVLVATS